MAKIGVKVLGNQYPVLLATTSAASPPIGDIEAKKKLVRAQYAMLIVLYYGMFLGWLTGFKVSMPLPVVCLLVILIAWCIGMQILGGVCGSADAYFLLAFVAGLGAILSSVFTFLIVDTIAVNWHRKTGGKQINASVSEFLAKNPVWAILMPTSWMLFFLLFAYFAIVAGRRLVEIQTGKRPSSAPQIIAV